MLILTHTLLSGIILIFSSIYAKRDSRFLAGVVLAGTYIAFFSFAPLIALDSTEQRTEFPLQLSTIFLLGFSFSYFFLIFGLPKLPPIRMDITIDEARTLARAANFLFVISLLVTAGHMVFAGVPWMAGDVNLTRHELKGSGYVGMFLSRGMPISTLTIMWTEFLLKGVIFTRKSAKYVVILFLFIFLQAFREYLMFAILYMLSLSVVLRKEVKFGKLAFFGILLFVIFMGITLLRSDTLDTSVAIEALRHRVGFELIWTTGYSVQLAERDGFWLGKSILMDLYSALPGPGLSFGDYLLIFVNPLAATVGLSPLTPSVIGEAYLNFGTVGVLLYGILLPVGMAGIVICCRKDRIFAPVLLAIYPIMLTQIVQVGVGQIIASRFIPATLFYVFLRIIFAKMMAPKSPRFPEAARIRTGRFASGSAATR